jgi:hypothetical protein
MSEKEKIKQVQLQRTNRNYDMVSCGTKNMKSSNCLNFLNTIETDCDGSELQWFYISFFNDNLFVDENVHNNHEILNTYEVKYCNSSIELLEQAGLCADGFELSINSTATVYDVFTEITSVVSDWVINDVRIILHTLFIYSNIFIYVYFILDYYCI